MSAAHTGWRKWLGASLASLLLIAGLSATSFADLRIVQEADDERTEVLVKDGRIMWYLTDEDWMMMDCARQEITFVSPPRYWQGPVEEFTDALKAQRDEIFQEMSGAPDLGGLFGIPSGSQAATTQVRVTRVGDETIAGYRATQYRVETGDGSQWKTYEDLWVSRDLMRELEGEIGRCTHAMMNLAQEFATLLPLGDAPVVYSDPAYLALYEQGFPMRSVTRMAVFGFEVNVESEVVEVSRARLDESRFTVPSSYERYESLPAFLAD